VDVWVGNGVPPAPQYTPEPGTLALAALGLVPFGLRRLRRSW
jgi:MYXO-CTERM domain-containing protein